MTHSAPHPGHLRRGLTRALLIGTVSLGLGIGTAAPALAEPTRAAVSLTIPSTAEAGETVTATIVIAATSDVFALDAALDFDSGAFSYVADSATGPTGGYLSVRPVATGLDLSHTRLGTSPALSGDLTLTVDLVAVASGRADVSVGALTLVGTDRTTSTATDLARASVQIIPAATASPQPTVTPTGTPTATAPTTTSPTSAAPGTPSDALAQSGFALGLGVLVAAIAAIAAGTLFVRFRKARA